MKLHYKSYGEGKPFVVLHGLFGSGDNWATFAKALSAQGYQVFAVDQRNHGRSPHDPEMNYRLMADDLQEFIQDHHLDMPVLLGHSMGGKTVMTHSQRFPGIAEAYIIADIAPRGYPPLHDDVLAALRQTDLDVLSTRKEVDAALRTRLSYEGVIQFLLKNLYWTDDEKLAWRFNLPAVLQHLTEVSAGIELVAPVIRPALFLRGENSDYVLPADEPMISSFFPRASIETVAAAGHWVHADNPSGFFETVLRFLDRTS